MIDIFTKNSNLPISQKQSSLSTDGNSRARHTIKYPIAVTTFILSLLTSLPAISDSGNKKIYNFNIASGDMAAALSHFAETTDTELSYPASMVEDVKAKALIGDYTEEQALKKLLENTEIMHRFVDDKVIALNASKNTEISAESLLAAAGDFVLAAAEPEGEYTGPVEQEDLTVSGRELNGYNVINATTATKTDTPIMETPFSVQVVPKTVMSDQQVIRLDKAMQNVSGVNLFAGNQGNGDGFIIRGFLNNTTYRDGIQLPDVLGGGTTKREMANLEQVEVLKGPGSILFGRTEPGGVVNMVTKKPQATPYYSLQQQIGSYDFYRTAIDATGPITEDDTLLYRLNLSYENADSFRDFIDNERVFVAPVLQWNISSQTQATLELEYQHFNEAPDPGIPPLGNKPAPVPIETALHEPVSNKNDGDRVLLGFNWSHEFNKDWKLSHKFSTEFIDKKSQTLFFGPAASDGTVNRFFNIAPDIKSDRYFTSVNLTGDVSTGPIKHTLLFGFDYFRIDDKLTSRTCCPAVGAFNVFNPTHLAAAPAFNGTGVNDFSQNWYGLYFQDQIELPYDIHVLGGFRYDIAEGINNDKGLTSTDDDRISPRGGIVWQPMDWLSVYGSYTENFSASNSLFSTTQLPPQTAQQWETGVKTEFWDGRLSTTVSYFELTKQNIRTPDPADLSQNRAIGEAETRGVEFDIAGEILPGWNVISSYSYMPFAKITKDFDRNGGTGNQGNRLFLAPEHSGSFWSTYAFQKNELKGLKVGAGAVAVGQRQGNSGNSYQMPGYVTANLMASYQMKVGASKVTAQLNVDNLLDKRFYAGSNSGNFITPGTPRTFLGSIRLEF